MNGFATDDSRLSFDHKKPEDCVHDDSSQPFGGQLRANLAALARLHGREGASNTLMRDADTRIADLTIEDVFEQGLHEFLVDFMASNAAIGVAIAKDYRFLA